LRARRAAAFTILLGICTACSSGPQARSPHVVSADDAVEVAYLTDGKRFTLRSQAMVSAESYRAKGMYGDIDSPDVKVADRDTMQSLIDALHELGYFERAAADGLVGARAAIAVQMHNQRSTWVRPPSDPSRIDELQRFQTAVAAFLHVHTGIVSYHSSKLSGDDLSRTPEELQKRNEDAVRNIQRKASGKGQ
jgi:hypothetical protein